jgi:predicted nucleic acid-binding protein
VIWLVDVSALLAFGLVQHQFHKPVAAWVRNQQSPTLATCPITELGFVRILSQTQAYGLSIKEARTLLLHLKTAEKLAFIPDDLDISQLPAWVKTSAQSTDGYLLQLAQSHGATLATLDRKIPGAFAIPVG